MGKQRKILAFVISLVFLGVFPIAAKAEEFVSRRDGLDVIFVMDYSGSMKTNDSRNIAKGMVKAFIDTAHEGSINIGFVAYNDQILSSTSPVPISTGEGRAVLKNLIDEKEYSGNTDIGLGLRYAYDLLDQENGRKKVLVLISDGESDLVGSTTGRDLEVSNSDLNFVVDACGRSGIPVYTIAFGQYDGSTKVLEDISLYTDARKYTVEDPEKIIEILYGILKANMNYSIKKITDGIYASGTQDIHIILDESYLNEMDLLMISPQAVGASQILYGEQVIEPVNLEKYAVAKISDVDDNITEMVVRTETLKDQRLQIYLVSYRTLTPVLEVDTSARKNCPLPFRIYFQREDGIPILDESFYRDFDCQVSLVKGEISDQNEVVVNAVTSTGITGELPVTVTGTYYINAAIGDFMGTEIFEPVTIVAENLSPEGSLPEEKNWTIFTKTREYRLSDYFYDADGDELFYSVAESTSPGVRVIVEDGILSVKATKPGLQEVHLVVSDGEENIVSGYLMNVLPLWRVYWWVIAVLVFILLAIFIKRIFQKPKSELESLIEEKPESQFCGKLDAYFTMQPEEDVEIKPLSFDMYKIKGNKITLGSLFGEYPNAVDNLELDNIYLVADKERRIILYHTSQSTVMIGNSSVCKQAQYGIQFGDVIYITSLDGIYDLEIHYIAVFQ